MKKTTLKIVAFFALAIIFTSCKEKADKAATKEAEEVKQIASADAKYVTDIENSTLTWKGFKPAGTHDGTVKISEGYVVFDGEKLTGGNFVIDMNSIKVLDLEDPDDNTKLTGHLKSPDFFNVSDHPYSAFTITGVEEKEGKTFIQGNLTIKDIKKNIEFPGAVAVDGDVVTFKSEPFTIDRTEWDIKYKSNKFFDDLKDKFINDEIEVSFDVKAKKSDA